MLRCFGMHFSISSLVSILSAAQSVIVPSRLTMGHSPRRVSLQRQSRRCAHISRWVQGVFGELVFLASRSRAATAPQDPLCPRSKKTILGLRIVRLRGLLGFQRTIPSKIGESILASADSSSRRWGPARMAQTWWEFFSFSDGAIEIDTLKLGD